MKQTAAPNLALELLGALHTVGARLEAALEPHGLSLAKFRVLSMLVASGEPVPLGELADQAACVRSNITQLVDRLEAEKLVVRVQDPNDRRSIRAELTPQGRARHAAGAKAVVEAEQGLLAQVPPAQIESFLQVLASLRECG
jgi:DNA-binding MarR family transcriptional regulator